MKTTSDVGLKTERIVLLASPAFRAFLNAEAQREGISVSALVRARCEKETTQEDAALMAMAEELKLAVREAKKSMIDSLVEATQLIAEMKKTRAKRERSSVATSLPQIGDVSTLSKKRTAATTRKAA